MILVKKICGRKREGETGQEFYNLLSDLSIQCIQEAALADGRAAKNDDARVRDELWGKAAVEGFENPSKSSLICRPGAKYDETEHEELFNELRQICLIRYRKNILKEFLNHMKARFSNLLQDPSQMRRPRKRMRNGKIFVC